MNKHLVKAISHYEESGINFGELLNWHLCFGIVHSDANCLCLCLPSCYSKAGEVELSTSGDTLFVTYYTGEMRGFLQPYLDKFKYIAFRREFKGSPRLRIYDIKKFNSKIK